jgi:hypothetical protein
MFRDIRDFIITEPNLPAPEKKYTKSSGISISTEDSREEILEKIISTSGETEFSRLALYIYRKMDSIDWLPFIKAAMERNPVCFSDLEGKTAAEVFDIIDNLENVSIYEGPRLALPDEVWNFRRGDGIEKALLVADLLASRNNTSDIHIYIDGESVRLTADDLTFEFRSDKNLKKTIHIKGLVYSAN